MRALLFVVTIVLAVGAAPAVADDRFHPVPDSGGLELRVVTYGHGVHGEMLVEVRNPTAAALTFAVDGLYFTPDDTFAAQRLGVVGAMRAGSEGARTGAIALGGGASRQVRVDVFCVDEHRDAPTSDQAFTLASKRMPARLIAAIAAQTAAVRAEVVGPMTQAQTQVAQGQVWEARRAVRYRLEGERR